MPLPRPARRRPLRAALLALALPLAAPGMAQTVLSGDHSVDGNLCAGTGCTGSESFPNDAGIKIKAASTRLLFEDTSGGGYPDDSWMIVANDAAPAGDAYLAVQDMGGGTQPFKVRRGAPDHALVVGQSGAVGLGTALPAAPLHLVSPTTPALRLEKTSAGGGLPYSWDIVGTELAFAVQDEVTGNAPLLIEPRAPDGALVITEAGNIGIGQFTPAATFDILRLDGTAKLRVRDLAGPAAPRTLLDLTNNGRPEIVMGNTATGGEWSFGAGTNFILKQGAVGSTSAAKTKLFEIDPAGNATLTGSLTTGGTTCGGGCDAVFTERAVIPAAEYHAAMWDQGFLPHVGPTPEGAPFNVTQKLGGMLNALEHAHVHNATQEARLALLEAENAALKARLARLETHLSTR